MSGGSASITSASDLRIPQPVASAQCLKYLLEDAHQFHIKSGFALLGSKNVTWAFGMSIIDISTIYKKYISSTTITNANGNKF